MGNLGVQLAEAQGKRSPECKRQRDAVGEHRNRLLLASAKLVQHAAPQRKATTRAGSKSCCSVTPQVSKISVQRVPVIRFLSWAEYSYAALRPGHSLYQYANYGACAN